jgi:hypothetical protein
VRRIVNNLKSQQSGGVVRPGEEILQIIRWMRSCSSGMSGPDIAGVRRGQAATVKLFCRFMAR